MQGAFYPNLKTGHFVARVQDIASGDVQLKPTKDFGGSMTIIIEALAVNGSFRYATSGPRNVVLYFDPVADAVNINLPDTVSNENEEVTLKFAIATSDADGSETLGNFVYVKLCDRFSFVQSFEQVYGGDNDSVWNGTSSVGYSRVPRISTGALKVKPDLYWHGPCDIDVIAVSIESLDDEDDDYKQASSTSFTITVLAVPTPANLTAPARVAVNESEYVAFPGLSADFIDKIPENGYETLSLFVSSVPRDSLFSAGTNVGDGVWSFRDVSVLEGLTFRPPLYFSGNISLTFGAIIRESSAPILEAMVNATTVVSVKAVASPFLMVAQDIQAAKGSVSNLVLNVRMEDNATLPGETAIELIELTFTSVPTNVTLWAATGGSINATGSGRWVFKGTQTQSNALRLNVSSQVPTGQYDIGVSGITIDGSSILASPSSDSFRLSVTQGTTARRLQAALDDVLLTNLPSDQCIDNIRVEGADTSKVTGNMFTLLAKLDHTVEFRFTPNFESLDNFVALIFPEAPIGIPSYPVLTSGDNPLTLSANCYANEAFFYVFVNSESNGNSTAMVPNTFAELSSSERKNGYTEVFEVTLPCSCISPDTAMERRLHKSTSPRLHKALAVSMTRNRSKRRVQQLGGGGEGKIEMELMMDVQAEESAGARNWAGNAISSTITVAIILMTYLL